MPRSARDLIKQTLSVLQVIGATDTPSAADEEYCRIALNLWIDGQNAHPLALIAERRRVHDLASGQQVYTIGPGADWSGFRPAALASTSVIPDPGAVTPVEIPLGAPLTMQQWQGVPVKSLTGAWPTSVYYDQAVDPVTGFGRVTVLPIPTTSLPDLVIYAGEPIASIEEADLPTPLHLKPGYERMFVYNLAVDVAPAFGRPVTPDIAQVARESRATVLGANVRPKQIAFEGLPGRPGARYNIYADR